MRHLLFFLYEIVMRFLQEIAVPNGREKPLNKALKDGHIQGLENVEVGYVKQLDSENSRNCLRAISEDGGKILKVTGLPYQVQMACAEINYFIHGLMEGEVLSSRSLDEGGLVHLPGRNKGKIVNKSEFRELPVRFAEVGNSLEEVLDVQIVEIAKAVNGASSAILLQTLPTECVMFDLNGNAETLNSFDLGKMRAFFGVNIAIDDGHMLIEGMGQRVEKAQEVLEARYG